MDTIVIVASLGRLKAYRVEQTPTRGKKLSLLEDMEFIDAHGGIADHVSDRSGRYPKIFNAAGTERPGHLSAYEAKTLEMEIQRRLIKMVGEEITGILERERPEAWYFAAGSEFHEAILNEVAPRLRERLLRSERADLVNIPWQELLPRFTPWPDE